MVDNVSLAANATYFASMEIQLENIDFVLL